MQIKELATAVKDMRDAQKEYFVQARVDRRSDQALIALRSSKEKETIIDKVLEKLTSAVELPPDVDPVLMRKVASLACNLVGFPSEIVIFNNPDGGIAGYRFQTELGLVEGHLQVYSFLKEFNVLYLQYSGEQAGKGKLSVFTDLISALYDYGHYWNTFAAVNREMATIVTNVCRQANSAAASDQLKKMTGN